MKPLVFGIAGMLHAVTVDQDKEHVQMPFLVQTTGSFSVLGVLCPCHLGPMKSIQVLFQEDSLPSSRGE